MTNSEKSIVGDLINLRDGMGTVTYYWLDSGLGRWQSSAMPRLARVVISGVPARLVRRKTV